ncbi:LacI family DNA-binding transcriptional regulator [Pedococcus sp. NPDC057267]|uniref:LacI family DNA-binding transcriptional regulator n=1 Tax=Pedococcus sp. NPDC057267 TaxID=3346077 RepID=UPI003634AF60
MTLALLAEELGVHVSTVSRALSEDPVGVGGETVEKIRDLARRRGYRRNVAAQSLRTGRTRMIGVMVPRLTDVVMATIYEGIDLAAIDAGYNTVVVNTQDRPELQRSRLDLMLSRGVDGIIVADSRSDSNLISHLEQCGVPYVLVARRMPRQLSVTTDDLLGGRLAAEHLLAMGHHTVGVVAGDPHASTGAERTLGFRRTYEAAGHPVPDEYVVPSGFDVASGRSAGEQLLTLPRRPTAIFAASDLVAVGVLGAMRDLELAAPKDVAVVGFNDVDLAAQLPVPLTTIHSPLAEMGSKAMRLLLGLMEGKRVRSKVLRPTLQVRESTAGSPRRQRRHGA